MKGAIARFGIAGIMALVAVIVAIPLIAAAVQQRAALHAVSRTQTIAAPVSPPSTRSLRARISRDAAAMAVSLQLADSPARSGLIAVRIQAVGPQSAIIAFAERLETRAPAMRFASWRVAADPGGIRLTGVAAAPASIGE